MFQKQPRVFFLLLFFSYIYHTVVTQKNTTVSDFCHEYNQCHNITNKPYQTYLQQMCYCEEENCWFYDDCCKDAQPKPDNIPSMKPKCQKIASYTKRYYIINGCPTTWLEDNVNSLCAKDVDFDNYHYILDFPFQSNNSNIMYSNVYCAICNQDYPSKNVLTIRINCEAENCSVDVLDIFDYEPRTLSWKDPNSNSTARIKFHGNKLRECDNSAIINECDDDWDDVNVSDQCRTYTNYVKAKTFSWPQVYYKNVYCAVCNGINISDIVCADERTNPNLGGFRFADPIMIVNSGSYVDLIDFSGLKQNCPSDHLPHYSGKCIPFMCGKGFVAENGECVDYAQNSTQNTSMTCRATLISIDELYFLPNESVFRNSTNQLYNINEYQQINESSYLICLNSYDNDASAYVNLVLTRICIPVSLISLTVHIGIHLTLGNYKKIPDMNLMNLSCALFLAQLIYFLGNAVDFQPPVCYSFAVFSHYFLLVVFFWMSAMAFDICHTITRSEVKSHSKKMFASYLAYSWLFPLLIVVLSICVDQTDILPELRPGYGVGKCWISQKNGLIVFNILPLSIILLENLIFFSLTAYGIQKTTRLTRHMTKSNDSNKRFNLYIKLAFVMGGTWILGLVSNFIDFKVLKYAYVVLNASQGTFVFIVFTLKRRILKKFGKKLSGKKKISSSTTSSKTTSTQLKLLKIND